MAADHIENRDDHQTEAAPSPSPDGAAEAALRAAKDAITSLGDLASTPRQPGEASTATDANAASSRPTPFDLPVLTNREREAKEHAIDLLADVNLNVKIELGRTRLLVEDVLRLDEGSVVELDKLAGDPVDIYVNERHIARGEVLVVNDNFCIRINQILSAPEEIKAA